MEPATKARKKQATPGNRMRAAFSVLSSAQLREVPANRAEGTVGILYGDVLNSGGILAQQVRQSARSGPGTLHPAEGSEFSTGGKLSTNFGVGPANDDTVQAFAGTEQGLSRFWYIREGPGPCGTGTQILASNSSPLSTCHQTPNMEQGCCSRTGSLFGSRQTVKPVHRQHSHSIPTCSPCDLPGPPSNDEQGPAIALPSDTRYAIHSKTCPGHERPPTDDNHEGYDFHRNPPMLNKMQHCPAM